MSRVFWNDSDTISKEMMTTSRMFFHIFYELEKQNQSFFMKSEKEIFTLNSSFNVKRNNLGYAN